MSQKASQVHDVSRCIARESFSEFKHAIDAERRAKSARDGARDARRDGERMIHIYTHNRIVINIM